MPSYLHNVQSQASSCPLCLILQLAMAPSSVLLLLLFSSAMRVTMAYPLSCGCLCYLRHLMVDRLSINYNCTKPFFAEWFVRQERHRQTFHHHQQKSDFAICSLKKKTNDCKKNSERDLTQKVTFGQK